MSEELKNNEEILEEEVGIYTLTDLETGEEEEFELLDQVELDGNVYMAFAPLANEENEFVILKAVQTEDGETDLIDIEDDEEFDRVADYFEDNVFGNADYDEEGVDIQG